MDANDIDEAWEQFLKSDSSFMKASVEGKLDTIAAQLQELTTDNKRLTEIIPKIMGDQTAIENGQSAADMMLGGQSPEDILGSIQDEAAPAEEEGMPPEEEEMPEEGAEEVPEGAVEKAEEDDDEAKREVSEEELPEEDSEPEPEAEPEAEPTEEVDIEEYAEGPEDEVEMSVTEVPQDDTGAISPAMDVPDQQDVESVGEEPPVEEIQPAGQEGLPPEGVPDLTDEINATQPDGLLNVYDRFIEGMKRAAQQAVANGDLAGVSNLAGAQNAIDAIWRTQVAPTMDGINGTDDFTKSCEAKPIVKSSDCMNGSKMSDTIESSHEVNPSKTSTEGEENTTGHDNTATTAPAPEGMVADTEAPHALNNDTTTVGSSDPASFEKAVPAEPPEDGQGMEPVEKSLSDLEGYDQPYADKDKDLPYADPIRKSVPSFREVMAEPKEERFMKMAEVRRGPNLPMEAFLKKWYGDGVTKSMTEGQPMEGTNPVEGADETSFEKEGGAMTAGTEGAVNPMYSDKVEKAWAGSPAGTDTEAVNDAIDDHIWDTEERFYDSPDIPSAHKARVAYSESMIPDTDDGELNEAIDNLQHGSKGDFESPTFQTRVGPEGNVQGRISNEPDAHIEKSTAGQAGPSTDVEEVMKSEDMIDDVNAAFEKCDSASTGTKSVEEEMKGPVNRQSKDTGLEDVESAMKKSMENGKPIASFHDMMAFKKSVSRFETPRPDSVATVNGDVRRPDESFRKSAVSGPVVRMGYGVRHEDVVAQDIAEYKLYKAQKGFN